MHVVFLTEFLSHTQTLAYTGAVQSYTKTYSFSTRSATQYNNTQDATNTIATCWPFYHVPNTDSL